uniref:Secreted protein n=1 Tax=Catharus ustulatus TaxID=91951 RepID=A0A8C3TWE6_CATUS
MLGYCLLLVLGIVINSSRVVPLLWNFHSARKIPFSSRFLQSMHTVKMLHDDGISGAFMFSNQVFYPRFITVKYYFRH